MVKYRFFQVVMALSLVILIISSAVMCSFMVRKVSQVNYKPYKDGKITSVMNTGQTGTTHSVRTWSRHKEAWG